MSAGTHLMYVPREDDTELANTEVLLCDDCWHLSAAALAGDDEGTGVPVTLVSPELERRLNAATKTSAEVLRHACKDHKHAACRHLFVRMLAAAAYQ